MRLERFRLTTPAEEEEVLFLQDRLNTDSHRLELTSNDWGTEDWRCLGAARIVSQTMENMMSTRRTTKSSSSAKERERELDRALDEAIEESLPASDPPAVGHSDHVGAPRNRTSENVTAAKRPTGEKEPPANGN